MQETEFNDKIHEIVSEALNGGNIYDEVIRWLADVVDQVREESET